MHPFTVLSAFVLFSVAQAASPFDLAANVPRTLMTKRQEACNTQCQPFVAALDAFQKCGEIPSSPTKENLECFCKPELFQSFEGCAQCSLTEEPTLENFCDVENTGGPLNQLSIICSNLGFEVSLISLTTPPGMSPSDCPAEGSPSGSGSGSISPTASPSSPASGSPQPSAPVSGSGSNAPTTPRPQSSGGPSGSQSGNSPQESGQGNGNGNGAGVNALNWAILGGASVVGLAVLGA